MDEEQTSAADGSRVANVCEAVVMLAALGGMDVTAADIRAASDLDADHERESTPPPPAA